MDYNIPNDAYPAPVRVPRSSHRRIGQLIRRGLAGEKHHYSIPRRILVPAAALASLLLLISCTAAQPELRETVVQTTEKLVKAVERILTREEQVIDPYAVQIDEVIRTESGVTVALEKAAMENGTLYAKLRLTNPDGIFAGEFLQFDTLKLEIKETDKRGREVWRTILDCQYGEPGILAGSVFKVLYTFGIDRQIQWLNTDTLSIWFPMETGTLSPGEYRIVIDRLYTLNTAADITNGYFTLAEEYGTDFVMPFTVSGEMESLPVTTLLPETPFVVEDGDFILEKLEISPLYVRVHIRSSVEETCFLAAYPEVKFAPYRYLDSMHEVRDRIKEACPDTYDAAYISDHSYRLVTYFRDGITESQFDSYSRLPNPFTNPDQYVMYHVAASAPILDTDLLALELVRLDGQASVVIWEAEGFSLSEAKAAAEQAEAGTTAGAETIQDTVPLSEE